MDVRMDAAMDTGTDTEDGRWMTYAELAVARRIDKQSAVKLAFRRRWRRQRDNRRIVRVLVPGDATEPQQASRDRSMDASNDASNDASVATSRDDFRDVSLDLSMVITRFEASLVLLREQLEQANLRAR